MSPESMISDSKWDYLNSIELIKGCRQLHGMQQEDALKYLSRYVLERDESTPYPMYVRTKSRPL